MSKTKPSLPKKSAVKYLTISNDESGQRIDNFLFNYLKRVPKSHIYRLLRKGELRINKKRISPFYRLKTNDSLRLPPIFMEDSQKPPAPGQGLQALLTSRILYEDEYLLIINKPSGLPVHAGNTVKVGVIEALRHCYPKLPNLELAHRLDMETSGCLILAKKKRILRELHELLRNGAIKKIYLTLTKGQWQNHELRVEAALHKDYQDGGKHVVHVHAQGKAALTIFKPLQKFKQASLMEVKLMTGRTHQIRVHANYQGHPIALDDRYGDAEFNKSMKQLGLKRLFLHAHSLDFILPSLNQHIKVEAPLDEELTACIAKLQDEQAP